MTMVRVAITYVGIVLLAIGASLGAASFVQLRQIQTPKTNTPQYLYTPGDGTVGLTGSVGTAGVGPLTQVVTVVTSTTANSFSCPVGTQVREVSDNIPMANGVDYAVGTNGAVVFGNAPQAGDVVILGCQ